MRKIFCLLLAAVFTLVAQTALGAGTPDASARGLLEKAGVRGRGVVLVLGAKDSDLLVALARNSGVFLHVLDNDPAAVAKCREAAFAAGLYGTRVVVEPHALKRLPHAARVCDAVIAPAFEPGAPPRGEVLRVLRPGGVALLGEERVVAPADPAAHDWNHWRCDPGNGLVSGDTNVPPYMMQWFNEKPFFAYAPNVTLAAGGRMLFVAGDMDYAARTGCEPRTIYAYSGYNGTLLWKRRLPEDQPVQWPGYALTADALYLATNESCLVLDPQTGKERRAIALPAGETGGATAWKWIALSEDGRRLFALLGPREPARKAQYGLGYYWGGNAKVEDGVGDTFALVDLEPAAGKLVWKRKIEGAVNGRSVAMNGGRIFYQATGKHIGCIEAASGKVLWTNADAELMKFVEAPVVKRGTFAPDATGVAAEGLYLTLWRRENTVAFSAEDGKVLWKLKAGPHGKGASYDGGRRILTFPDHLLIWGADGKKNWNRVAPETGKVEDTLTYEKRGRPTPVSSGNCCIDTANAHTFFSSRRLVCYNLATKKLWDLANVRSTCTTGAIPANGFVYATPTFCRCGFALHGVKCFAPAGAFEFGEKTDANAAGRLESAGGEAPKPFDISPRDWPTYRGDNGRRASSAAQPPKKGVAKRWEYRSESGMPLGPPTAAGGLLFLGGRDGIVRALDSEDGRVRWRFFTGGEVNAPPTLWKGRALFGSHDGHVYALEAATGRSLWRFRVAPAERTIGFRGALASTWPVAGGVVAEDGAVYAGAGILDTSGTYLCGLDAQTGQPRWTRSFARHLPGGKNVSVKGFLAAGGGRLLMPAGTSLAAFSLKDGSLQKTAAKGSRGSGVVALDRVIYAGGRGLYQHDMDWGAVAGGFTGRVYDAGTRVLPAANKETVLIVVYPGQKKPLEIAAMQRARIEEERKGSSRTPIWKAGTIWRKPLPAGASCDALVFAGDVALAAVSVSPKKGDAKPVSEVLAFSATDGAELWRCPLPARAVPDGLLVDRDGRVIVVLRGGRVICLSGG